MSRTQATLLYLVSLLLFGSNGILASAITLPSFMIVLLRTCLGAGILIVLMVVFKGMHQLYEHKREVAALAISGAALGVSWLCLFEAYRLVGVGIASLAYYCGPVIVMALAPIIEHEHVTRKKLAAFSAVVAGCFLVVAQGEGSLSPWGILLGFMAACAYAVMIIFGRRAPHVLGINASAVQVTSGFFVVLAYTVVQLTFNNSLIPALAEALPSVNWTAVVVLGVINTGLACGLYFFCVGKLPLQTVSVWGYLEPLSAVVMSILFLGEGVSLPKILGALLIVGGACASEFVGKDKRRVAVEAPAVG